MTPARPTPSPSKPSNGTPRASLRLTVPGRTLAVFVGVALLPAVAIGGAVALLPALVAALLAAAALGAWLNLRALEPAPPEPRRAFAGEAVDVELVLANRAALFAARDVLVHHGEHAETQERANAYVPSIRAGEARTAVLRYRLAERGRQTSYAVSLASSFPLGLVEARRAFELPADFLAFPRLGTVRGVEERLPPLRGVLSERSRARLGTEEFYALREWRPGESQHLVHWKASARLGKTIVRELVGEERPRVHVELSTALRGPLGARRKRAFEEAVSVAATLAEHFVRRGVHLRFTAGAAPPFECGHGWRGLSLLLTQLALVQPQLARAERSDGPGDGDEPAPPRRRPPRGEVRVLVRAGGGADRAEAAAAAPPDALVLDVDERAIDEVYSRVRAAELALPRPAPPRGAA